MKHPVRYVDLKGKKVCRRFFMSSSLSLALFPSAVAIAQTAPMNSRPQVALSEAPHSDQRAKNLPEKVTEINAFILFSLAVNESTIRSLIQAVNIVRDNHVKNIYILIDSTGGTVESAIDFFNFIQSIETPVHTVNMSQVSSAANYIYLSGEKRYAYPASYFLLHPAKSDASIQGITQQSFDNMKSSLAASEGLAKTILLERTKIPKNELERTFRSEVYYSAGQALAYGIVNETKRPMIRDEDLFMTCSMQEGGYLRNF